MSVAFRQRQEGIAGLSEIEDALANEGDLAPRAIDLGDDGMGAGAEAMVTELDDGSAVFNLEPQPEKPNVADLPFNANLAEHLSQSDLSNLGSKLKEGFEADKQSRQEWEQAGIEGMKLLGFKTEDRSYPFAGACGVFDPLMADFLIRFQASFRAELMPAAGPVKTRILGTRGEPAEQQASRVQLWMNTYLTTYAPEYYPEFEQSGMWFGLWGNIWRYAYHDPLLGRAVVRLLTPQDFYVSYTTDSIYNTPRATIISQPSKRDLKLMQMRGEYLNVDIGDGDELMDQTDVKQAVDANQGVKATLADRDDRHKLMHVFVDEDLQGFRHCDDTNAETGLPLPYLVTMDANSQKVLSIRRNWRQFPDQAAGGMVDDPNYRRIMRIADYKFLPGFGYYGIGGAHTLGGFATAGTKLLRQLIDKGTLENFPGGLRVKGMRIENNKLLPGPGEFLEIDTGGMPIRDAVAPTPYGPPSVVLKELRTELIQDARRLASTQEIAIGEGRQDAPVGTTVALLEAAMRVESGVIRRAHVSLGQELRFVAEIFGETLPEQPYPFMVPGGEATIMRSDFSNMVDIIPVSDPNITSNTQRIVRAEALKRSAMEAPQIHDMRASYRIYYTALGLAPEQIDMMLPAPQQPQPFDPVTENQMALTGKPIAVFPWQNDDAHIAVHQGMAQQAPPLMAHIAEHLGSKFRKMIEAAIGQPLPPLGATIPPEIQEQIGVAAAGAMAQIQEQMAQINPELAKVMGDMQAKKYA